MIKCVSFIQILISCSNTSFHHLRIKWESGGIVDQSVGVCCFSLSCWVFSWCPFWDWPIAFDLSVLRQFSRLASSSRPSFSLSASRRITRLLHHGPASYVPPQTRLQHAFQQGESVSTAAVLRFPPNGSKRKDKGKGTDRCCRCCRCCSLGSS